MTTIMSIHEALANPATNNKARFALFMVDSTISHSTTGEPIIVTFVNDNIAIAITIADLENCEYHSMEDFFNPTHNFYPYYCPL